MPERLSKGPPHLACRKNLLCCSRQQKHPIRIEAQLANLAGSKNTILKRRGFSRGGKQERRFRSMGCSCCFSASSPWVANARTRYRLSGVPLTAPSVAAGPTWTARSSTLRLRAMARSSGRVFAKSRYQRPFRRVQLTRLIDEPRDVGHIAKFRLPVRGANCGSPKPKNGSAPRLEPACSRKQIRAEADGSTDSAKRRIRKSWRPISA